MIPSTEQRQLHFETWKYHVEFNDTINIPTFNACSSLQCLRQPILIFSHSGLNEPLYVVSKVHVIFYMKLKYCMAQLTECDVSRSVLHLCLYTVTRKIKYFTVSLSDQMCQTIKTMQEVNVLRCVEHRVTKAWCQWLKTECMQNYNAAIMQFISD